MYERFRLPIAPVYGGFPVKFRTFLGDPIPYDPNTNATELAEKARFMSYASHLDHRCLIALYLPPPHSKKGFLPYLVSFRERV